MLLALFAAGGSSLPAQEEAPHAVTRAVVPVVGNVTGLGEVRWRTDVRLFNPYQGDLEVALTLPGVPGEPFLFTTVAAGQSIVFNDVIRDAFGLDDVLSPLVIQTLATRSIVVSATIRGPGPAGSVQAQGEPTIYTSTLPARAVLHSLSFNEKYRTNVGLANLGESKTSITLALQRISGRNVATKSVDVAPGTLVQIPLNTLFPVLTEGDDLILVAETENSQSYVYASVIRNESNDGVFVGP